MTEISVYCLIRCNGTSKVQTGINSVAHNPKWSCILAGQLQNQSAHLKADTLISVNFKRVQQVCSFCSTQFVDSKELHVFLRSGN
ncbi:hypothetical protein GDO78_003569 [Eleutherodactylus coqui]|uniref:Uncharacterized protein n=1 Tax=Eleutherodactylus coqui TaxID=57060 RepID=A0A8J6ESN0_ELECQ|nr:hypothetical protein GDO78_003569 [Eleutherodactylus coqui]